MVNRRRPISGQSPSVAGREGAPTVGQGSAESGAPSHDSSGRFRGGGGGAGPRDAVSAARSSGREGGAATARGAGSATAEAGCEARTGSDTAVCDRGRMQDAAVGEGRAKRDVGRRGRAVLAARLGAPGGALEHRTADVLRGTGSLGHQDEQQHGGEGGARHGSHPHQ